MVQARIDELVKEFEKKSESEAAVETSRPHPAPSAGAALAASATKRASTSTAVPDLLTAGAIELAAYVMSCTLRL